MKVERKANKYTLLPGWKDIESLLVSERDPITSSVADDGTIFSLYPDVTSSRQFSPLPNAVRRYYMTIDTLTPASISDLTEELTRLFKSGVPIIDTEKSKEPVGYVSFGPSPPAADQS